MDAKVATSAMADHMMVWAEIGRPNETVRAPRNPEAPTATDQGLYPGGYYLFSAQPTEALSASVAANETARAAEQAEEKPDQPKKPAPVSYRNKEDELWKGWLLPESDADTWFVAGSARYYRLLQSPDVEKAIQAERVRYRGLKLSPDDPENRFRTQETKGTLFLDSLRRRMGDEAFLKLMQTYFAANTTQTVTAQSFLSAAAVPFDFAEPASGPAYLPNDIGQRLESAVIVYGTAREAGTNRYAAERLQARFRARNQRDVPLFKDFEATDALLAHKDVIFIGRPESNSALAAWSEKIGLDYESAVFRIQGTAYASERSALVFAAKNPLDETHMVLVYAGNAPMETVRALSVTSAATAIAPWIVLEEGKPAGPSALPKDAEN